MNLRYCEMCDLWVNKTACPACGMPTREPTPRSVMAAAPAMLVALKETMSYWDSCGFSKCDDGCECIVEIVRNAIAKAEGAK